MLVKSPAAYTIEPLTKTGKRILAEQKDDAKVEWVHRDDRYQEKLATPDVTIADLIGEVDLVKHAEGRYLSDESTMHYGLIPRANRGIFAINELPDLAPRIQVGLFNVLEERDIQIRGYPVSKRGTSVAKTFRQFHIIVGLNFRWLAPMRRECFFKFGES